jgi:hypothetical protein
VTLTIVSGAAPGAEQGAIEAAINLALDWQGWASRDHIAALPAIYRTGLQPTSASDPGMVRRLNCQDADGALVFSTSIALAGVAAFVDRVTEQMGRAFLHVTLNPVGLQSPLPDGVREHIRDWIRSNELARVYVTGPSADDVPGIQGAVRDALIAVLEPFAVDEVRETTRAMGLLEQAAGGMDVRVTLGPPADNLDVLLATDCRGEPLDLDYAGLPFDPPEGLDELQRAQLDASIREAERDICGPDDMARARDRLADSEPPAPGDQTA